MVGNAAARAQEKLDRRLANGKLVQSEYDTLQSALNSGNARSVNLIKSINQKKNLGQALGKAGDLNDAMTYATENADSEAGQQIGSIFESGRKGVRNELRDAMDRGKEAMGNPVIDDGVGPEPTTGTPGSEAGGGSVAPQSPQDAINVANDYYNNTGEATNNAIANAQDPTVNEGYYNNVIQNRDDNLAYIDELFDLGYQDGTPGARGEKYRNEYNTLIDQAQARGVLDTSMSNNNIQDLDRQLKQDKAAYGYDARNKSFDQLNAERNSVRDLNAGFVNLFGQEQGRALGNMLQASIANGQLSLEQAKLLAELIQFEAVNRNNINQQQKNNNNNNRAYEDQQDLYNQYKDRLSGEDKSWWNPTGWF